MKTKHTNLRRLLVLSVLLMLPLAGLLVLRDVVQAKRNHALISAAFNNDLPQVEWLVRRGADVNTISSGQTPLESALTKLPFDKEAFSVAHFLIKRGANPNTIMSYGKPVFFAVAEAIARDRSSTSLAEAKLLSLMLDKGVRPGVGYNLNDILFHAVRFGSVENVRSLIRSDADVNGTLRTRGAGASTVLLAAIYEKRPDTVAILLEHRANPDAIGAIYNTSFANPPLIAALNINFLESVPAAELKIIRLLLRHGADVNVRALSSGLDTLQNGTITPPVYEGFTPLMTASYFGSPELVEIFLKAGANPKLRDEHGKTALDYARQKGHTLVVRVLEAR